MFVQLFIVSHNFAIVKSVLPNMWLKLESTESQKQHVTKHMPV